MSAREDLENGGEDQDVQHGPEANVPDTEVAESQNRTIRPRLRLQLSDGEEVLPMQWEDSSESNSTNRKRRVNGASLLNGFAFTKMSGKLPSIRQGSKIVTLYKLKNLILQSDFSWVTKNMDATHIKPALRAAVAAWVSLILMIIPKTQRILGQASFLILIAAFLSPPLEPFTAVIEREIALLFLVTIAFAWSSLGIYLSSLSRKEFNNSASVFEIFSGQYIEAGPTVICGVFLFIGTSFLLYMRARIGPGPYMVPFIISCIVTDISLTVGPLFPYAYYRIGESVVIPISFHSAIAIASSIFVFPETINAQFVKRFHDVFVPLASAIRTQPELLSTSPTSDDFDPEPFKNFVGAAESALAPVAATSRLMKKDISWGRFGPNDFSKLHELARRLTVRANGMAFYFKIIDPAVDKQPGTPALSNFNTPASTPPISRPSTRPSSPVYSPTPSNASVSSAMHRHNHHRHRFFRQSFFHRHHHSHHRSSLLSQLHHPSSLFHEVLSRTTENPVGVFESQRYLNIEIHLSHPESNEFSTCMMRLLGESAKELLTCCADSLDYVADWLERLNTDRYWKLYRRAKVKPWEESVSECLEAKNKLQRILDDFRGGKRLRVLDMYRAAIDTNIAGGPLAEEPPPHRYLFQSYVYQYHLIIFSTHLVTMLDEIVELEKTRRRSRLWLPTLPFRKIFIWSRWEPNDSSLEHNEDEDPDIIPGIDPEGQGSLDMPRRRDPDALPPVNTLQALGSFFHRSVGALGHGNAVFGFKAGVLTVLLSLPSFLPSSAKFAYVNRSVWAIVLGQLTVSRFRGDTAFGWTSRVIATFLGGIIGTVMWYISTGSGNGNPFGLAAVTAVCFPFFFFARMYFPASPMTLSIFFVTTVLVIGYSWQDTHLPTLSNAGRGFQVAWKRFILVTIGVTVAFISSFLPPSTTLRRYLRTTYATTAGQIGQLYCDIVSYATVRAGPKAEDIVKDLIAIRLKLKRLLVLKKNVSYEFSLRGEWPKDRYNTIHEIQMEIAYSLSHLRSVTEHLDLPWARAFLRRTRFLEPDFQGDVLAVISMISTALRTGTPLPQVTPCPLLDRFVEHHHGLNILRQEEEADYGLPRTLTIETLEDEQYLYYSVGVATAYGIVSRLDRLMIATKELVGEQYHIHGLALHLPKSRTSE